MVELKTLKDIELTDSMNDDAKFVYTGTIRFEAIKWVKELRSDYCMCHEEAHLSEWKDDIECVGPNNVTVSWIMHFFNIREDELK